ncbi:MAG: hypothetical protein COW75_07090, partial [Rhodobacterales bacterium CG18_big_fil_WC_8_21_14_2_50_71_9]
MVHIHRARQIAARVDMVGDARAQVHQIIPGVGAGAGDVGGVAVAGDQVGGAGGGDGFEGGGPLGDRGLSANAQDALQIDDVAAEHGVLLRDKHKAVAGGVGGADMGDLERHPAQIEAVFALEGHVGVGGFGAGEGVAEILR